MQATERAAGSLGVKLRSRGIGDVDEVNDVMSAMKAEGAVTLVVQPSPFTFRQRHRLITSAMNHGLGTIYPFPGAARDGAMIAFGPDYVHRYRRSAPTSTEFSRGQGRRTSPCNSPRSSTRSSISRRPGRSA